MPYRNVLLLALCQAIGTSGAAIVVLLSGIAGAGIAPSPNLATLPISLGVVSTALASIPAALLMRRIGRQAGFILSALVAGLGAALSALAIVQASFVLLCVGIFLIGQNAAFGLQYRFAAAESVPPQFSGRAISLVLVGGILAGYLGPQIATLSQAWLPVLYAGSFAAAAGLYILAGLLLAFYRNTAIQETEVAGSGRPLSEIARQPNYQVAVLAGVASYGLMSFIMTATPLHMHGSGYHLGDTAFVIQSHIIAMYLPSLVTGFLIEKLGTLRIVLAGAVLMVGSNLAALLSVQLPGYWTALVLLGLGWNLLFVGGTVMLTKAYRPEERFKAQAGNDFSIFAVQALSSFSAGALLHTAGWSGINLLSIAVLALLLVMLLSRRKLLAA
ncbi:MAG: MFS transporter [Anaerolineales bacterium]|nr:MFS transporter [Anaerolineales bacterium]